MKLQVGERLAGSGPPHQPGGYVITEVVNESPWSGLYAGKKILYNFDFTGKRVRETDEKEWLDVYLRTIRYPYLDDADYVANRRMLLRAELNFVLGQRASNLWLEPVDLIEVANTRDAFTFAQAADELEPIAVFSRPHGQLMLNWAKNVLPLASILSVLAELLEFIDQTHREMVVLQGLGPMSLVVDQADRVHFLASDMVASQEVSLIEEPGRAERWQFRPSEWLRLFPAERFPRGFAAPECFSPDGRPDRRSDLYAWGSLAFFLLTGKMPWQIALEQGRPWAHFQQGHFEFLDKVLRDIPASHIANWMEQLGIRGQVEPWAGHFLTVLRQVLSPDPRTRPANVAELRQWLQAPPPPPLAGAVAFRTGPSEGRIFLDYGRTEPTWDFVVQRQIAATPNHADKGYRVHEGQGLPILIDPVAPAPGQTVYYGAFTRRIEQGHERYSTPVFCELQDPTLANIVRLADAEYLHWVSEDTLPPRVELCFRALDPVAVSEALLGSPIPVVRRWGLERLQKHAIGEQRTPKTQALFWRVLKDPVQSLRLAAAKTLLDQKGQSDDYVYRVVQLLGDAGYEEAVQAAKKLPFLGVDQAQADRMLARIEGERPHTCPLCKKQVAARERATHLRTEHGYVEVAGSLLSREKAIARLWDLVLLEGNAQAHEQLVALLPMPNGKAGTKRSRRKPHPFVTALEAALGNREEIAGLRGSDPSITPLVKIVQCLRSSPSLEALAPPMLRSSDTRVREIAREALLPVLGEKLSGPAVTPQEIRKLLEQYCPGVDLLEERIQLCHRLPQVGVDNGRASLSLVQLQEQKPVRCTHCVAWVRAGDIEIHLMAAHQIYQFRKTVRSPQETRAVVLKSLCRPKPDVQAWRMLEAIARMRPGKPERRLVVWICHEIARIDKDKRPEVLRAVAEAITASGKGRALLPVLLAPVKAAGPRWLTRCWALELAGRLPPPVDARIAAKIKPYLSDRRFPRDSRQRATIGLLQTTGKEGKDALDLLQAYVKETGKLRAIEKLHDLEKSVGTSAAIDTLCQRLEDLVRMSCPRCSIQLRRIDMVKHLWSKHQLLLDGRRVREPWHMIDDWVVEYSLEKDPSLLKKCKDIIQKLGEEGGAIRLQQMLLSHGIDEPAETAELFKLARRQNASLCPRCFALVPVPEPAKPATLKWVGTELRGQGYRLEVSDHGLIPWLEIETPEEILYRGRESGRWLTALGGAILLPGPIVLAVFIALEILTHSRLPALALLGISVVTGLLLGFITYFAWPRSRKVQDRLVDAAWSKLVPELLTDKFTDEVRAFLAALAGTSVHRGTVALRDWALEATMESLRKNGHADDMRVLASLVRLRVFDLLEKKLDPLPPILSALREAFLGRLPMQMLATLVDGILGENGEISKRRGTKTRLRVLALEAAFSAAFELAELNELGKVYPPLIPLLGLGDEAGVTLLRGMWSLRTRRPWTKFGQASTVFELAADPQNDPLFEAEPGILLAVEGLPLELSAKWATLRGQRLRELPDPIRVEPARDGFRLIVGSEIFLYADPPERLARDLQRWLKFHFEELLPQLSTLPGVHAPDSLRKLRSRNGVPCGRCHQTSLPRLGQIGIKLSDD